MDAVWKDASSYFSLKQIIRTLKRPINFHAFQSSLRCSFHSRKLCILTPSFYKSVFLHLCLSRVSKQTHCSFSFSLSLSLYFSKQKKYVIRSFDIKRFLFFFFLHYQERAAKSLASLTSEWCIKIFINVSFETNFDIYPRMREGNFRRR